MKMSARFDSFPPYTPIEPFEVLSTRLGRFPDEIIKLDANENPYGPSPKVRQALAELQYPHIYPDPESRALRAALAQFTGVPIENLLASAGADELIDLVLRVLLDPGDRVLVCPPTLGMYAFDTRLNAGEVVEVPRRQDFSLDLPAIQAAVEAQHPKILFATQPNNPDGGLLTAQELETLLSLPLLVVLDEAYIEFASGGGRLGDALSCIRQVPERENLVVLRTFSKWAGLAGLRVGYGAFPGWLMPVLWKAKQPYNVNVAASQAALASLADLDTLAANIARLQSERQRLFDLLRQVPFLKPFPSQANFILCQVLDRPAADLKVNLAAQGVLVRYYDTPLLKDYIRVSTGRPVDTDALAMAFEKITPGLFIATMPSYKTRKIIPRVAQVDRQTRETSVHVSLALDGSGKTDIHTGIGFLDHMLAQLAMHGLFDLTLTASGDLDVDCHHTMEDVALSLGMAFQQALGEHKGIVRTASAFVPMDESLALGVVDFSGRPYAVVQVRWNGPSVGGAPAIPTSLFNHFLESFASQARCNLHVHLLYGQDDHHQAEAIFKALGRALDAATRIDSRRAGGIPSTKGVLRVCAEEP